MITQEYRAECDAPVAWGNPVENGETKHYHITVFFALGEYSARSELAHKGWYAADNGNTYCPFHAENARRIDQAAREKARAAS